MLFCVGAMHRSPRYFFATEECNKGGRAILTNIGNNCSLPRVFPSRKQDPPPIFVGISQMPKILLPQKYASTNPEPHHIQRLKSIFAWRLPKEGSSQWADFRLRVAAATRNPEFNRSIKERHKVAISTAEVISHNGAGLPADSGLREFGDDYNNRVIQHGLHYLPTSFNILEAFFEYNAKYALFFPLSERNHICTLAGYLDFLSIESAKHSSAEFDLRESITENLIYHFSFLDGQAQWLVGRDENKYTFRSASILRRKNEVTMLCLVGKEANLRLGTKSVSDAFASFIPNPDKPHLTIDENRKVEAVALEDGSQYWRHYLSIRYNVDAKTIQARYIFEDWGASWRINTDDPVSINAIPKSIADASLEKYVEIVEQQNDVFVFVARLMRLVEYFNQKQKHVVSEKSITSLVDIRKTLKGQRRIEHAIQSQIYSEREVLTLRAEVPEVSGVFLPTLELKVEVEGYWEKLPFGSYGEGPDGARVLGRTWVRKTLSKRQSYIASPTIASMTNDHQGIVIQPDPGFIYVLRNAAHQIDIFKIGLTRRNVDTRAAELSRGTGIPDHFLTVQSWWVPDVVFAEKRIHQLLDEFRLRDKREFFRADYPTIRAAVDLVVNELSGRAVK